MEKTIETLKFGTESETTYLLRDADAQTKLTLKADKSELPVIPTKVSAFENDKGYLTEHQDISGKADNSFVDAELAKKEDKVVHSADLSSLVSRLTALEEKVADMKRTNVETTTIITDATDTTVDYIIKNTTVDSSSYSPSDTKKQVLVKGKSVTINNGTVTNDARLSISADDGDVEIKNVKFEGAFPKATSNPILYIDDADNVIIKDLTIDATSAYNGIEIGLNAASSAKSILIDNCQFKGHFDNNGISIFGMKDDAVININNCYFEYLSNMIRLSNKTNAKNVTVNITNCKCDKWETINWNYAGMIICQDNYSGTKEAEEANNVFGPDKMTINIINCEGPYGKVKTPADISSVCGSQTFDQILYVYYDKTGVIHYNASKYPTVNIL